MSEAILKALHRAIAQTDSVAKRREMNRFRSKLRLDGAHLLWTGSVERTRPRFAVYQPSPTSMPAANYMINTFFPGGYRMARYVTTCGLRACVSPAHLVYMPAIQHGKRPRKLTREDVIMIHKRGATEKRKVIAADFGVVYSTIYHILRGNIWSEVFEEFTGQPAPERAKKPREPYKHRRRVKTKGQHLEAMRADFESGLYTGAEIAARYRMHERTVRQRAKTGGWATPRAKGRHLEAMRVDFESGLYTGAEVAARYRMNERAVRRRAKTGGWVKPSGIQCVGCGARQGLRLCATCRRDGIRANR